MSFGNDQSGDADTTTVFDDRDCETVEPAVQPHDFNHPTDSPHTDDGGHDHIILGYN